MYKTGRFDDDDDVELKCEREMVIFPPVLLLLLHRHFSAFLSPFRSEHFAVFSGRFLLNGSIELSGIHKGKDATVH